MDASRPFLDDNQLLVCPLCPKGFKSLLEFNLHVSLHEYGNCHIADCCLASSLSRVVHRKHDYLGAGLKGISFGLRPSFLGSLAKTWDTARHTYPGPTVGFDKGAFHDGGLWCRALGIAFIPSKRTSTNTSLYTRLHMLATAQPSRVRSILLCVNLPESPSPGLIDQFYILGTVDLEVIRSFRRLLTPWSRLRSPQIELEEEEHNWSARPSCLGSVLNQLPRNARVFSLFQSLGGLSTNLIFLLWLDRYLSDYDAWFSISFGSK